MRWAELETAAPEIAVPGRALVERHRFVLAGTIRRDGTPRISPVEAHFVEGHLVHAMIAGTLKVRDLRRDSRIVLNAPVTDPADPGEELKLRGRAVETADPALREAVADAVEAVSGWRPRPGWPVFWIDVDEAAYMLWEAGVLELRLWTAAGGVRRERRPLATLE